MELISYKVISTKYYECVFIMALVIQHASFIFSAPHHTVISGLLAVPYIFTLSHIQHGFRKKVI
jgi:hypothetical protein